MKQNILTIEDKLNALNRTQGFNVSTRYRAVNTVDVVNQLKSKGYEISKIDFARNRSSELGTGKHLIRFRHPNFKIGDDGLIPEIILKNSYNTTTCFHLYLGVYRQVCSNGLMVGTNYQTAKIKHVGDPMPLVLNAAETLMNHSTKLMEAVKKFSSVELNETNTKLFALYASRLLVPLQAENIQHTDLLRVRRQADSGNNLWLVFNRIQENALRGGLRYQIRVLNEADDSLELKNNSTRVIKSIDRIVSVNRELWNLAERMAV